MPRPISTSTPRRCAWPSSMVRSKRCIRYRTDRGSSAAPFWTAHRQKRSLIARASGPDTPQDQIPINKISSLQQHREMGASHPHSHILVRGVTGDGKTLNIAGDYIAYGIRERASEIVTRELGRQTELEVTKQLEREVDADRFTGLDRMLIAEQQGREFSDLRPDQDTRDTFRQNRALLIERARKLERIGLATEIETGKWIVSPKAEPTLRELGERGDIIKAMHRALEREGLAEDRHPAGYVVHRENATERIVGRVLDKGLGGDEMGERVRLVIDGVDGRVHHIEMDAARAEEVSRGMIVVVGSVPPGLRAADRNIWDVAGEEGIYRSSQHLERARAAIDRVGGDPEAFVRSHVRRLEAPRRGCPSDRIDADHWRGPPDA